VVGVIHPRIVTPSDFETTFDASEREMILTHERIHIEGNDARINALAALAGCICWFNPLVHLGAYFMRIDQELACDASVVSRHPEAKSLYASALLKAQLARAPLPLGCHWPSRSEHPLLQRVAMLGRAEPARGRRIMGVALLGLLAAASGVAAWAALPPEKRVVERQSTERQDVHAETDRADGRGNGAALPGGLHPINEMPALGVAPAPEPQQTANQQQVHYSTFVVSADKVSVETGQSTYEGNVSLRFFTGQNADAIMRAGDFAIIQYPQTRGLALQDVSTDGPLRVTAARNFSDLPTNTVSWEGRVEVRLVDVMIAADQVSFQTPPTDKTMLRSIRFEQRTAPSGGVLFGVDRLEIEGNKHVTTEMILALMDQKPGAFDGVRTDESTAGLRASGLFRNFNVMIRGNDKSTLFLRLDENDPVPGGETETLRGLRMKAAEAARKFAGVARRYDEGHPEYQRSYAAQLEAEKQLNAELNRIRQDVRATQKIPAGFDANDPVYLRGTVEKIDFSDTTYTAYVRARSIASGPAAPAKTDDHLWKLSPINYWGDRDRVSKDILRQDVNATGYRTTNKACGPNCEMYASTMTKCSVLATFAPGCAADPNQPAPYQQQTPPAPAGKPLVIDGPVASGAWGPGSPVVVRGKVERIDFGDTKYTVFVRASSASWLGGYADKADTSLFELSPTPYWGDRVAINADLKGKDVVVQGSRASSTCEPACRINVVSLKVALPTALPPITQTPGFSSTDVVVNYDASAGTMIEGVVQRIEFGERTFDAYVQLRAALGVPGELYQVRSEYRFPRAEIEKQLKGKTVYVAGWPAKPLPDMTCSSPCGLYATDIRLGSGEIISPAGVQLVTKVSGATTGPRRCFRDYNSAPSRGILRCTIDDGRGAPVVDVRSFETDDRFDINAPVTIDGRIVRADKAGYWVEINAFEPANTPGAEPGKTWYVENDTPDKASYIGQHITARGFNAKDTACKPECRMLSLGYSINLGGAPSRIPAPRN
ncbi:MAG TPA: M56 family metallopeptidase, partial [Hyphomonadaceae bacterium]|nr:M56 family metallopeptidase [Hyphomonadaceae bacterium]